MTGNDVLNQCRSLFQNDASVEQAMEGISCAGYVSGLNDMAVLTSILLEKPGYCLPRKEGLGNGQVIRVFLLWLEKHPAELHESARSLFLTAMGEAFPCSAE